MAMRPPAAEEQRLRQGLENWQRFRLSEIEASMVDLSEDFRAAQEGLGIAHRNPGEVAEDIIGYLWKKQNDSAIEVNKLEQKHQELLEMDLPHLIIVFKNERREKPDGFNRPLY